MKILATIQARMGSTRLPEKVMLPILDKPVIWHIFHRLQACRNLDQICVAFSSNNLDDKIEKFLIKNEIQFFRGSEKNLIERLLGAANKFEADAIVRITGDCPLIDPAVVDKLVEIYKSDKNYDFVSNTIQRTFPHGLDAEVISKSLLNRLSKELKNEYFREWFPTYIIQNKKNFNCFNLTYEKNLFHMRWTLDYKEDYQFITKVYEKLYNESRIFYMQDILELLEKEPKISELNKKYSES